MKQAVVISIVIKSNESHDVTAFNYGAWRNIGKMLAHAGLH